LRPAPVFYALRGVLPLLYKYATTPQTRQQATKDAAKQQTAAQPAPNKTERHKQPAQITTRVGCFFAACRFDGVKCRHKPQTGASL
jgi:hypothetical protein